MSTVADLISNALTELNALAPGEAVSPDLLPFCFGKFNRLAAQWTTRSVFIWTTQIVTFVLTPSQTSYTIGPGGDIDTDRPVGQGPGSGIKYANIILTEQSPAVHCPLAIWDDEQWANVRVNEIPVTLPTALYNDGANPLSNIYLWGYPTQANTLELFVNKHIPQATALSDDVEFPEGYEEAFTLSLAVSLGPGLAREISADLRENERRARTAIESLNTSPPLLSTDSGIPGSGGINVTSFNYRSGSLTGDR